MTEKEGNEDLWSTQVNRLISSSKSTVAGLRHPHPLSPFTLPVVAMVAAQQPFLYTNHNKRALHEPSEDYHVASTYKMQNEASMMMPRQYRTEMERGNLLPSDQLCVSASLLDQPLTALSWTDIETDKMVQQLEFMTEQVCEDKTRFPKAEVSRLLRSLQKLIRQPEIRRDDPLLRNISRSLKDLQLVDLDKLAHLLHATQQVEEELVGKDLLLLSGPSGSGKTTTLHFLAGTEFEECEVEGFFHLEPVQVRDPQVAKYQTSCCRYGVTQSLQTAKVQVDGQTYYVCDTPGFDTLDSIEDDIAHGIGTVRAIQKARTVRPILIFCKDNLGHRFVNLNRMWGMVTRQFVLGPETGLKPFNYIFTKFESKHRTRLNQQFAHFKDDLKKSSSSRRDQDKKRSIPKHYGKDRTGGPEHNQRRTTSVEEEEVFKSFIDDIVEKTTPEAQLVLPLQEKPQTLLRRLVRSSYPVCDPQNFFAPMAAETSLAKLQIQLEMTLHELSLALAREDYTLAIERLEQLRTIARLLPEAEPYSKLGVQTVLQHATMLYQSLTELLTTKESKAKTTNTEDKRDYATAVVRIRALEQLAKAVPQAEECSELAQELLWRSILEAMESSHLQSSTEQIVQVSVLLRSFPKALAAIRRGLEAKRVQIVQAAESGDCAQAVELLLQVAELAKAYPEANACLEIGFKAFQEEVTSTIERHKLTEASDQIQLLAKLCSKTPLATDFAGHAMRAMLTAVESELENNEYPMTVSLVENLMRLNVFPEECINRGVHIIWNVFELVVEDKHYIRAIGIMETINGLAKISPKAYEYTRMGLEILGDRLLKTIHDRNYNVAMKMLLHMTKMDCDLPQTLKSECVTHGLQMIQDTAEKAVQQKNYKIIMELFRDLMQLDIEVPEAGRCARRMLTTIHEEFDHSIRKQNFALAIELLHNFTELEDELKEIREFTSRGQESFELVIKDKFRTLEPSHTMHLIDILLSQDGKLYVAGECARFGLRVIRDSIEEKIDQHDYVSAAETWNDLYEVSLKHPKAKKTVQVCFLMLRDVLSASLTEQNYKTATCILRHFGKIERELPEADKCARQTLAAIKNALISSIDQQDYGVAFDVLQVLVDNSKDFPDGFKCAQFGMQQLQKAVEMKVMDKKDYRKALEMMEKSVLLSEELPEALKCAQVGLKIILKATENAIDQGDYGVAVDLMNEVHNFTEKLPEAYLCSEISLQAAVRHLSWLRKTVVSVIDQLLGSRSDDEKFGEIIGHLKGLLQSILQSESLRYLCLKLHEVAMEKEPLEAGEDFCTEQLRRLTEHVVSDLLNIEVDKTNSESLTQMKSSLLSTIIRLKVMNDHLYQCPGGSLVTAAYNETFKDFYGLINGVLQNSERRTAPPENMELFALQTEFLSSVLTGFMGSNLDITDAEYMQVAELENRRLRLLRQFGEQIEQRKSLLLNYTPSVFEKGKREPTFSYIQRMDFKQMEASRNSLLAIGKCPTLCELMPSKPAASEYLVFVKKFDVALVALIQRIVFFLEKELAELVAARKNLSDKTMVERMGEALFTDTQKMSTLLALVSKWSNELEVKCRPETIRVHKLKGAVEKELGVGSRKSFFFNPFQCT